MMGTEREKYRAVRSQGSSRAYEIAPIAALFEDCLQYFEQLCTIMESDEAAWQPRHILIDDYFSKFRDWGSNTGASSRALDHALRKASRLQETTKDLLQDLRTTLHTSKTAISFCLCERPLRCHCIS